MKSLLFILLLTLPCLGFSQHPTSIITDTNTNKAYMIDSRYLLDLDLGTGKIKRFRFADSVIFQYSQLDPILHLYNNSYLLVHAYNLVDCKTYLMNPKGTVSWMFDRNVITDRSGTSLFAVNNYGIYPIDSTNWAYRLDKIVDFEKSAKKKGHLFGDVIGDFCILSADGNRVAILQDIIAVSNKDRGIRCASVFDTKTGKLLCSYEGSEEDSKNEIKFMDFSADGKYLIMGNSHRAILYNVDQQEKMGSFDEDPKNNRERFTSVAFFPNSSNAIICSRFKIYTVGVSKKFDYAIENVTFGGESQNKIVTTYIVDEYNAARNYETTRTYNSLNKDYYWDNFCISSDNRYILGLIRILDDKNQYIPHINKYLITDPSRHKLYELNYGLKYGN